MTGQQVLHSGDIMKDKITRFSFGDNVSGFEFVGADTIFSDDHGYGWIDNGTRRNVIRPNSIDSIKKSFVLGRKKSVFRLKVPAGRHTIILHFGDSKGVDRAVSVSIFGTDQNFAIKTEKKIFKSVNFDVKTVDGIVDIIFDEIEDEAKGWAIFLLELYLDTAGGNALQPVPGGYNESLWALPRESQSGARASLRTWRSQIAGREKPQSTGLSAADYLKIISGCVDYFRDHQDERGAIIDPYLKVEFQYSTPFYAYVAALLAVRGGRSDLLESSFSAYTFAAAALGNRSAADRHEDFYPSPLAHAHALLSTCISADRLAAASEPLRQFNPYDVYRKPPGGRKRSGANWNCKALAGHWLLIERGLQNDNGYVTESLARQGHWFDNEDGLYNEGPATYDVFPRAWLADMLHHGYSGPYDDVLLEALERGAISSLFMQSSSGELATGGRSSQHQWSDALQCVIFEWAALRAVKDNDAALAGTYKRAAHRAVQALLPWRRPSGEFWIVKNRVDPELRHGYEGYSSHSQYNLLAAAALGYAFEMAQQSDAVPEEWCPSELGRFVFTTGKGIDRVFATADGTQVEAALVPVPNQTPRGVLRIHVGGHPSQLPMTDGVPDTPLFHLPDPRSSAIALGLAWDSAGSTALGGDTPSVAGLPPASATTTVRRHAETVGGVFLALHHKLLGDDVPGFVDESLEIEPGTVTITWNWDPKWNKPAKLRFPVFASDGEASSKIRTRDDGSSLTVEWAGSETRFSRVGDGERIRIGRKLWPFRCGWFRIAELPVTRSAVTLRISVAPSENKAVQ